MNFWILVIGTIPIFQSWNFETRYAGLSEQRVRHSNHLTSNVKPQVVDSSEKDESKFGPCSAFEIDQQWIVKQSMIEKWIDDVRKQGVLDLIPEPTMPELSTIQILQKHGLAFAFEWSNPIVTQNYGKRGLAARSINCDQSKN